MIGEGGSSSSEVDNASSLSIGGLITWTALAGRLAIGGRFDVGGARSGGVIGDNGWSPSLRSKMLPAVLPDLALEAEEEVELEIGIGRFGVTIALSCSSGKKINLEISPTTNHNSTSQGYSLQIQTWFKLLGGIDRYQDTTMIIRHSSSTKPYLLLDAIHLRSHSTKPPALAEQAGAATLCLTAKPITGSLLTRDVGSQQRL